MFLLGADQWIKINSEVTLSVCFSDTKEAWLHFVKSTNQANQDDFYQSRFLILVANASMVNM